MLSSNYFFEEFFFVFNFIYSFEFFLFSLFCFSFYSIFTEFSSFFLAYKTLFKRGVLSYWNLFYMSSSFWLNYARLADIVGDIFWVFFFSFGIDILKPELDSLIKLCTLSRTISTCLSNFSLLYSWISSNLTIFSLRASISSLCFCCR